MSGSNPVVSAFKWVPDFAQGQVRDLRVRWALEEMGQDYDVELLDATKPRGDDYKQWQPFGQVPAFRDGDLELFETGAILLYLGERNERLLPRDPQERWSATSWAFAALNSIEPFVSMLPIYDVFNKDEPWAKDARPAAVTIIEQKFADLERVLAEREWLVGAFSVADILMVTVLRIIDYTGIVDGYANVVAYRDRGLARPAFKRALDAQCAIFAQNPPPKGRNPSPKGE